MTKIAATTLAAAVTLAGCEDVSGPWMPLAKGNRWEYNVASHGIPPRTYSVEVVGKTETGSYTTTEPGGERIWSNTPGFIAYCSASDSALLLALPPHTGYKWSSVSADGTKFFCEITGREEVTVPAGRFEGCVHVVMEHENARVFAHTWFARDVGIVRRSIVVDGREVERMELKSTEFPVGLD